jgi:hypothetical protein
MTKTLKSPLFLRFKHPLSINALFAIFSLVFSLISCSKKTMAIEKLPTTRIEFGHGGGFTGAVTTYVLLDNGRIYEALPDEKNYKRIYNISKDETTTLYEECEKLKTLKTDSPGNMYYFVTMKKGEEIPRRWIFGDPATATPQELEALYKRLAGLVPSKN